MPAQSRAQRRRANAATQQRRPGAPKTYETPALPTEAVETPVAPVAVAPASTPASASRVARRLRTARAPEPIDYAKEYGFVARDLRLIALWTVLLFVAMAALYFARSNGMF